MVSPVATLLFMWAAVYAYVGVYFCTLHVRRPSRREYLAFGLLCFGLMVWSAGSAIAADAHTMREAIFAYRLEMVGGFASPALFVHFATLLVERSAPRTVLTAYAVGVLGLMANVGGLIVPTSARVTSWGIELVPGAIQLGLTPLGVAALAAALGLSAWSVWIIARGVEAWRDLRPLVWTAAIAVVAATGELATRVGGGSSVFLFAQTVPLLVLTVSFLLQRRFLRTDDELGERTDELRRSYSELRIVQEELVRKEQLAAVGELSAVIAHEVRNPLAIIKNAISSLRRPTLRDGDRGVLLGILDEEVDRLNRLVRNLLAYARPVAPQGEPVDVLAVAEEAVEVARAAHEDPDAIEVKLETDGVAPIDADPTLLRQAIENVAANAMQAMPDGGTLTVRVSSIPGSPPRLQLEFEDSGTGMTPEVLVKAINPFFTTRPSGTGLGLAIVDRVVKNHGGSISIESEPGHGTIVRITLPRARISTLPDPSEEPP